MITHPNFDPIAVQLGFFAIHWYGLAYLAGFLVFRWLGHKQVGQTQWDAEWVDRLLLYGIFGVIVGGRLGQVLFYQPLFYLQHPLKILALWEGGMSFHGGLLGVAVAIGILAYRTHCCFWQITDFAAPLAPLGLAFGRLGNFINGELYGKVTPADMPWAMLFPHANFADHLYAITHPEWFAFLTIHHALPRHPTQLYEMALEGLLLFVILYYYRRRSKYVGQISGMFLLCYGAFRFLIEWVRETDSFSSFVPAVWMGWSMGQWLSLPMIGFGIWLLLRHRITQHAT